MAEEENPEERLDDASGRGARPGRRKAFTLGGVLALAVGVAYIASLMAIPSRSEERLFEGPFISPLATEKIQVNLKGQDSKRYLVMMLSAEYDAYDKAYVAARIQNPLYHAMFKDAVISLTSNKTIEQVTDAVERDIFMQEIVDAVEPLLFPVLVGDAATGATDSESGLRAGVSIVRSTMRGPHFDHVLHVDTDERTISLDDGAPVKFRGTENDLMLGDANGNTVYVDVTRVVEHFIGDVNVGVWGHIRNVYRDSYLIQ